MLTDNQKREAIEEGLYRLIFKALSEDDVWHPEDVVAITGTIADALAREAIVIRMNVEYDKEAFTGKPMTYIEEDGGVQSLWVCGHKLPPGKAIAIILPEEEEMKATLVGKTRPTGGGPSSPIWQTEHILQGYDVPRTRGGVVVKNVQCPNCQNWHCYIEDHWIGGKGYVRHLVCDNCGFWQREV